MDECSYCGEDEVIDLAYASDEVVCRTVGCHLAFLPEDVDPEDLAFGFHIITEADLAQAGYVAEYGSHAFDAGEDEL